MSLLLVRERVDGLNEKLELLLSGEKAVDGELSTDGALVKPGYGKKPCKYHTLEWSV